MAVRAITLDDQVYYQKSVVYYIPVCYDGLAIRVETLKRDKLQY